MSDLEPLDPKLHELLTRERGAYADDPLTRDAVLRRIQAAIVLAPLAIGGAAASGAALSAAAGGAKAAGAKAGLAASLGWKGAAVIAVVAFGGGVAASEVHHAVSDHVPPPAASSSPITRTPAVPSPVPALTPSDLPSAEPSATPPAAPAAPSATAPAQASPPTIGDPSEERALVDTARSALARGRGAAALTAIDEHAKRFPRGRLAEEREALAVQALALSGDRAGALARAARFRRAYPNSIFGSGVDRAVQPLAEKRDAGP